ncbi:MAG: glutamine--fructose-6-phosphate transaminase (isomerizing) [Defluviitaleaceae bacterium]|nr:glutamine--fructose-6-phosphate transaminase (isomerizing) [Defluviitaleaceae bacterium]
MCGIVGYTGEKQASSILIEGLKKLEYRGYDSAGIAVIDENLNSLKAKGKVKELADLVAKRPLSGTVGLGHTRWATHGVPNDVNSHPHLSNDDKIALVHNGIIENYAKLKEDLIKKGYIFHSETDTEVGVNLINYFWKETKDPLTSIRKAINAIDGHYAFGIIFEEEKDAIYAVRKQNPLVIGMGNDENFIASDFTPALSYTKDFYLLEEGEIAKITKDEIFIIDIEDKPKVPNVYTIDWDIAAAEKGGYEHFMLKEIHEQPKAVRDTITDNLNEKFLSDEVIKNARKVHIVACGSALHAGLVAKPIIEKLAKIPTETYYASEFRYTEPLINKGDICIVISQSGETADTLAALTLAKSEGAITLSIVNVLGSTIARESEHTVYTKAGPEIAVATTKAYSAQLSLLYLVAIRLGEVRQGLPEKVSLLEELKELPNKIEELLGSKEAMLEYAKSFNYAKNAFIIGRGLDFAASMEASLKLKELSYIHSEAYASGELKHGTISLIEQGTPVLAVATQPTAEKTISNLLETIARGASPLIFTNKELDLAEEIKTFKLPATNDMFMPSLVAIPLQFFSYYSAYIRDCDIDMPRNLAKSVTVE